MVYADGSQDTRRRSISVSLLNSSPIYRHDKRISIWEFYLLYKPHMRTTWKACRPFWLLRILFSEELSSLFFFSSFFFFRVVVLVTHLGQKQKIKGRGQAFQHCRWLVKDKTPCQIRKIERGLPKQRLYQHLGWPSSHTTVYTTCLLYTSPSPRD